MSMTSYTHYSMDFETKTQVVIVNGEQSSKVSVTSGVPQGSVLGPCQFLFFINDLAEELHSTVCLFADDTIAYPSVDI